MKQNYFTVCFILAVMASITCSAQSKKLLVTNPAIYKRQDELIILKRTELPGQLKALTKDLFLKITDGTGKVQTAQFDDLDHDGIWDEAVFLCTLKPLEQTAFSVGITEDRLNSGMIRAHVRQRRKNPDNTFAAGVNKDSIPAGQPNTDFSKEKLPPFLTEGPAWENDKVGFRLYLDVRNGKDIWGKTTTAMMMDTVGVDPTVIYHNRAPWGMDVYKVGSSLSAGALALILKLRNGNDTLIRLGGKNMGKVIYEKVADGPVRAIFRIKYPEWNIAPGFKPVSLTEEISIWGGQFFYQSSVTLGNAPPAAKLVTGFANLYQMAAHELESQKSKILYSYGLQSENKDNLGLAILGNRSEILSFGKSLESEKDIRDSYLVTFKPVSNNLPVTFRFYAAWQPTDTEFADLEHYKFFLRNQSVLYDKKVNLNWK